jgi:hypothetical protein
MTGFVRHPAPDGEIRLSCPGGWVWAVLEGWAHGPTKLHNHLWQAADGSDRGVACPNRDDGCYVVVRTRGPHPPWVDRIVTLCETIKEG